MNINIQKTAITYILLSFSCLGHAISKDKHPFVTHNAISVYQSCLQELELDDSLKLGANNIAEATKEEDESPLFERYFNWHFHDKYNEKEHVMGRSLTGANKSLHKVYNSRINSLMDAIQVKNQDIEKIYKYTGSVIHYVQDMTVPAHVAPIYHYDFIIDRSDYFDEMPEWKGSANFLTLAQCKKLSNNNQNIKLALNTILNNTAKNTRNRIKQIITTSSNHELKGKTWEEFWVLRDPTKEKEYPWYIKSGFSPYGLQGREGWEKFCDPANPTNRSLCMTFFNKSYESAINNSVRVLLLINNYFNAVNTQNTGIIK